MSFKSNVGKPRVAPSPIQCEMVDVHHSDCECASCVMMLDVQCLEPAVGVAPDAGVRVCAACAVQMVREEFQVTYAVIFTAPDVAKWVGDSVVGVTSVKVDLVKPGVVRVRVVGGDADDVLSAVSGIKPVGAGVVVEHQADAGSAITEMFL